ncbi:hypothetical protein [Bradyrhizobium cajani]|uniref:hypothetical protein n=1 Tax=Bradyrhizobium cajani TaxID=1928661 RepID=UPI00142EAC57|nr:hypothetical protein [Bradyrhizobium cajani]MCP3374124.1 hypothetical protein [Bradyrhizobium cajani]
MGHPDRSRKGEPQPWFFDLLAEVVQGRFRVLLLPADRRAEVGAGSPEEVERILGAATETIELGCESCNIEPVGIVERHRKAQQRQLPGPQQPV